MIGKLLILCVNTNACIKNNLYEKSDAHNKEYYRG